MKSLDCSSSYDGDCVGSCGMSVCPKSADEKVKTCSSLTSYTLTPLALVEGSSHRQGRHHHSLMWD